MQTMQTMQTMHTMHTMLVWLFTDEIVPITFKTDSQAKRDVLNP